MNRLARRVAPLRSSLGWLLPAGVIVHLALTLRGGGEAGLLASRPVDGLLLGAAAGAALVPPLLHALRLRAWLGRLGGDRSWRTCLRIVAAGEVGAALTPSALGGAPVKTALLAAGGRGLPRAAAVTTMGAVEDLSFNAAVALPALLLSGLAARLAGRLGIPALGSVPVWSAAILALALVLVFLIDGRRGGRLRARLGSAWASYRDALAWAWRGGRGILVGNMLLAWLQWSVRYSLLVLLALGLGLDLPWVEASLLQWLGFAACTLVPTPGAAGGAEAVFAVLYRGMVPDGALPQLLSGWRLLTFYWVVGAAAAALALTARTADRP